MCDSGVEEESGALTNHCRRRSSRADRGQGASSGSLSKPSAPPRSARSSSGTTSSSTASLPRPSFHRNFFQPLIRSSARCFRSRRSSSGSPRGRLAPQSSATTGTGSAARRSLIVTMMTMGVATVGIGLVPSYETIGIWGAVLLTIGRLVQGLSIGGEWSGGVLLAGEWSHPKRRAFTTSFAQAGGPAGMVLANAALALMTAVTSEQEFLDWGWRIPFLASIVLVVVGLYLRVGVLETPVFTHHQANGTIARAPVIEVVKRQLARDRADGAPALGATSPLLHFHDLHHHLRHAGARVQSGNDFEPCHDPGEHLDHDGGAVRISVRPVRTPKDYRDRLHGDDRLSVRLFRDAGYEIGRARGPGHHPGAAGERSPVRRASRTHRGKLPRIAEV